MTDRVELVRALLPSALADKVRDSRGRIEGERKQVTVLFADVEGSTALARELDPEDVVDVMNGFFTAMVEAVHRYEGTVDKFLGDGILALFGAPLMHEDDPRRAVLAALDMRQACREQARRVEATHGVAPRVRIGINTGTVVVGTVGSDLRMEYTAMGDAVNLAQRIESACPPGGILITAATRRLVAPLFELRPHGPHLLKGIDEPVPAWEVTAARPEVKSARGVPGLASPLVGRDREMATLTRALDRLAAGHGSVVVLEGEAGLGKSRLVSATVAAAGDRGIDTAVGHALSYGAHLDYHLARSVVHSLVGAGPAAAPAEVAALLRRELDTVLDGDVDGRHALLALLLGLTPEGDGAAYLRGVDPEVVRARTHRSLGDLVEAKARRRPLLLVWEDLHWSDPSSLQALAALVAVTASAPLMLLLTRRPHSDPPVDVAGAVPVETVELRPLTPADTGHLVANLLDLDDVPSRVREKIAAKADGNPFYVEEILRDIIDRGAIVEVDGRWRVEGPLDELGVPDTIEGLIGTRIDRLGDDDRRTLQVASVLGRSFDAVTVADVVRRDGDCHDVDASLAELARRQLILPSGQAGSFTFTHALTQDTAYAGMLRTRRRRLHRHTAEALEAAGSETAAVLAHHFDLGGVPDRAVHYLELAGRRAAAVYANEEAARFYTRALELTDDPQLRFRLAEARADLFGLLARRDDQRADIDTMLELAEALADPTLRVDALRHLVSYRLGTDYLEAEGPLREALDLATRIDDRRRHGLLLRQLARFHRLQYRHPLAVEALTAALERFEAEGLDVEVARTLAALAAAHTGAGQPADAYAAARRAVRAAETAGDPRAEAEAHRYWAWALMESGRHEEALDEGLHALRLVRRIGNQESEASTLDLVGIAYIGLGRSDDAESAFRRAADLATEIGDHSTWLSAAMMLVEMWEAEGRIQQGFDWLTDVLARAGEGAEPHHVSYVRYALGYRVLRWLGAYEEALDHVNAGLALVDEDSWQPPRVMYRNAQATLLSLLGRHDEADATLGAARRIAEEHRMHTIFPHLEATGAGICLARGADGDLARARRHTGELLAATSGQPMRQGHHQQGLVLSARIDLAEHRPAEALDASGRAVALGGGFGALERPVSPQEVWYVHARALAAAGRPAEAAEAAARGRTLVETRAAAITDGRLRDSFLRRVDVNRALLAWDRRG